MTKGRGGRRGRGAGGNFGNIVIGDELRIAVNLALKNFCQKEEETELEFPSSLLSTERAYVHKLAVDMGLMSKSRGKGQARYLTVFKKEGSTIVSTDAELRLTDPSLQLAWSLLARHPVTTRDKQTLLPAPDKEHRVTATPSNLLQDSARSMGRLGGGISQVPPLPGPSSLELRADREDLPIWRHRAEVVGLVASNQVVLVTGDTGSGKTTQVPQYLLEEATQAGQPIRVVVAEPRRLAAVTVADRVSSERGEKVGGTVGYQIRLESCVSPRTCLTFCTYGVLLRSLMGGDLILSSLTHVVLDEIHERDAMSDFLITVMRDALARYRNLRLILMSATVDTAQMLAYYPGCVHLSVGGRMFPVQELPLEQVLQQTKYNNRQMEKVRMQGVGGRESIEELVSRMSQLSSSTKLDQVEHSSETSDNTEDNDDVVIEGSEEEESNISPSPELDDLLSRCFLSGRDEDFAAMFAEDMMTEWTVNYQHSETGVTVLMVAASRDRQDLVELALQMGADCLIKAANGWTALDFCRHTGHTDCLRILEAYQSAEGRTLSVALPGLGMTDEQRMLVQTYQATVDSDQVDAKLILHILLHIHRQGTPGAVLVFLPGYEEISTVRDLVAAEQSLMTDTLVLILHSQVASQDHRRAFQPPPRGKRKIILATNVAETSITVPDVVFVVDSGKVKQKTFDALTNTTMLRSEWISQTSATQRKGRAGRCQPGVVYRLFSSTTQSSLSQYGTPEILRTPLLALCLQTKLLAPPNTPIADFLARVPDPPPFLVTRNAVQALKALEALDPWEEVTPLGSHLLDLPLDPVLGKVLLHGVLLKCLDPVLTITCTLAYRNPFVLPVDPSAKRLADIARKRLAADTGSDHMAVLRAFQEWQQARMEGREKQWCARNMVSSSTMEMVVGMRNQVLGQLRASGFVRARGSGDIRDINTNSDNWGVVKACLVAGMYPNMARLDKEGGAFQLRTHRESKVRVHPGSVLTIGCSNKGKQQALASMQTDWMVYDEMTRVGRTAYIRGVTPVSPLAVSLFAGPARLPAGGSDAEGSSLGNVYLEESSDSEEEAEGQKGEQGSSSSLHLDSWTSFRCRAEVAQQVGQLRQKWSSLWLRRLQATCKQARPQEEQDDAVVATLAAILQQEDFSLGLIQPHGIGQRPKQLPIDLTTGQPTRQTGRRPSDSMSTTSEDSTGREGVHVPTGGNSKFFIVKPSAGSLAALEAAMSHSSGIWSFPTTTERRLMSEVSAGFSVMVVFSVAGSGAFQGCAVFTGQTGAEGSRTGVRLDWIPCQGISFASPAVSHLNNRLDEGRRLQTARDGQEVDQGAAASLLLAMGASLPSKCSSSFSGGHSGSDRGVRRPTGSRRGQGEKARYFR